MVVTNLLFLLILFPKDTWSSSPRSSSWQWSRERRINEKAEELLAGSKWACDAAHSGVTGTSHDSQIPYLYRTSSFGCR
jgi:hypothetical protein